MAKTKKKPTQGIPWDSPELVPLLLEDLSRNAYGWSELHNQAPANVPDHDRVLAIARITRAAHVAFERGDQRFLSKLAASAKTYLRGATYEKEFHGVRLTLDHEVLRHERHEQAEFLAQMISGWFTRNPGLPADEVTRLLVAQLGADGGLAIDLRREGIDVRGDSARARVLKIVGRQLRETRKPSDPDFVKALLVKALTAIGYTKARWLFDAARNRERRNDPRTN